MEENTVIRKEDKLWKVIMEELFSDFISFLHPGIEQVLDLERGYQFLDKELEQVFHSEEEAGSSKLVDKLVRVYSHDGNEEFVLLHFEFQAQYRANFEKRMFTYFSRLMDKYDRPISAYAIFTEATKRERPDVFSVSFLGTELNYKFNTYQLSTPTNEELLADSNPFAMVVLAARGAFRNKKITDARERDRLLLDFKIDLIKRLASSSIDIDKRKHILIFIKRYIIFELKETIVKFEEQLKTVLEKTNMGFVDQVVEIEVDRYKEGWHLEGKLEGKMEQAKISVRNLIKKSNFSDRDIAKLNDVSLKFVKNIRAQIGSTALQA